MAVRCIQNVTVGFPAGGAAAGTVTNWVIWATGELRVDTASFALFFTPAGAPKGQMASKPLGCMLKAVEMGPTGRGEGKTFVATTNDPVHSMVRMGFHTPVDEETFAALAQSAEVKHAPRFFSDARRSSVRASMASADGCSGANDELTMHIRSQHPDKWLALVFCGCELYGPDPRGDQGCEVLLGRGAVALLDPQDSNRVGTYELVFYDDGSADPLMRVPIGPRTRLTPQPPEEGGRLSVASRRCSYRPAGHGVAFDFSAGGSDLFAFSFDDDTTAASFARDLTVRQRLAVLSLKTSRGRQAMTGLQGEIYALQRGGAFAVVRRAILQLMGVIFLIVLLHGVTLYMAQPEKPIPDLAQQALSDAVSAAASASTMLVSAGSGICTTLVRSVPVSDLEQCTAHVNSAEAKDCVIGLVAGTSIPGFSGF
eukprot:TRINITY_DN51958_c0_g1_i1.p1 TRINITY_DN51958_c0_g1~~TRINITY_DN51958_c0_g1_i1.p1  ORF type:complete len:426 (-),score=80.79 TRINITY_DN51958_c0_g1_i1:273-1550(-)